MKGKAGYIFPMILFASLAVGLLVLTLTQFQSSNRLKYQHLNDYQAAFNIAYSALVEVLADIQSRQWSNRSFKSGPKDRSENLFGGSYNLRVEDHASVEFMFNVKVRVKFKEKSHLFYWRMQYNPSLLDFTNLFIPVYYEEYGDPANAPSDIDSIVDEIIQKRNDNLPKVEEIADRLRTMATYPRDQSDSTMKRAASLPSGRISKLDAPLSGSTMGMTSKSGKAFSTAETVNAVSASRDATPAAEIVRRVASRTSPRTRAMSLMKLLTGWSSTTERSVRNPRTMPSGETSR